MRRRVHTPVGFTLIEVLLVMTIIAILAGTIVVNFGNVGDSQRVRAEAERLALAIETGRSRALRRNAMWGVRVSEGSYDFKEYSYLHGKWRSVDRPPFATHAADDGIAFAVRVYADGMSFGDLANLASARKEDDEQEVAQDGQEGEERESHPIDIAILPGGELTPFDVAVRSEDVAPWVVRSDGIQAVRALPASEGAGHGRGAGPHRQVAVMRRGFTLLELLIALAILAIVSVAVFESGGDTVRQLYGMEQRTLARWVAETKWPRCVSNAGATARRSETQSTRREVRPPLARRAQREAIQSANRSSSAWVLDATT